MVRVWMLVLSLLAAGYSASEDGASAPSRDPSETDIPPDEPHDLRVEELSSKAQGQGPQRPGVILAPSAQSLSGELGVEIPDSGEGTYLISYWGEKPTGGYSLGVDSARLEGDRITVRLTLEEPPSGALQTQALTYPQAVAVVRDLDPAGKKFSFVDRDGRNLGWQVRLVGA
ncbi:MAG: protease complex subunit PrcB family protein [Rubrobacter sp.]